MDTHLSTIAATLASIAALQSSPSSSSRTHTHAHQPFTRAILNPARRDILDTIRDADPLEAALFCYPPSASSGNDSKDPSSSASSAPQASETTRAGTGAQDDTLSLLAPRVPQPRPLAPPSPLARGKTSADPPGEGYDAKTLLVAAQRLLDNYHHAPRARKHIRTLLKRRTELQRTIGRYEQTVHENEQRILALSARASAVSAASAGAGAGASEQAGKGEGADELANYTAQAQREEMEIFALEAMLAELKEQHEDLRASALSSSRRVPGPPPQREEDETVRISAPAPADLSSDFGAGEMEAQVPGRTEAEVQEEQEQEQDETVMLRSRPDAEYVAEGDADEFGDETAGADLQSGAEAEMGGDVELEEDERERADREQREETEEREEIEDVDPEPSDELERIAENIWTTFGDALRYVAPEREGADFVDTLRFLSLLSSPNPLQSNADGDVSLSSSHTGHSSAATSSTSTSTATTTLASSGPPNAQTVLSAHILRMLLRTVPYHALEFASIKNEAGEWWEGERGRAGFVAAGSGVAGAGGAGGMAGTEGWEEKGDQLATKAVYGLVAKKLLRIKRAGGAASVGFA